MNYTDITTLALSYADRQDNEVRDRVDDFIKVVEARVNRRLNVRKMAIRAQVTCVDGQEYYGLPADFGGLRDIEVTSASNPKVRHTMHYLSPEQMNKAVANGASGYYYTIIADQFQIYPPQIDDSIVEIVYYKNLTNLTSSSIQNWLSMSDPDVYIFGILVEISSFVKDAAAKAIWDQRFNEAIAQIIEDDDSSRWSGTALTVRAG